MDTVSTQTDKTAEVPVQSTELSADQEAQQANKALLNEARQTREMLLDFQKAIETGNYQGHQMLAVAKGLSFLQALAQQNKKHIENLQERIKS